MEIVRYVVSARKHIVACRRVARQRSRNKQLYNSRCWVMSVTDARNNRTARSGALCAVRAEAI
jgi:hypothetical protein